MSSGLDLNCVGVKNPEMTFKYTWRDAVLYAVGVGAQADELPFVYENSPGGIKVLPSFATIARGIAFPRNLGNIFFPRFIHGEELIHLHQPFPSQGEVLCFSEVTDIFDKGRAAVIHVKFTGLTKDREPLFDVKSAFFYLGGGGFGGDRGPKSESLTPPVGKEPDFSITYKTAENQAIIYRLNGDLNPLHIDPELARQGGQEKPILHGLCTYGHATRAILYGACNGDVSHFKEFKARFTNVVYPGETLITEGWKDNGRYIIQVRKEDVVVLSNAYAVVQ
ncbi:MAG: MaoC/PaaZ C-terminal domain-containing protein [Candidatus Thorarchaeota archaeon]